jgi:hypothetical protein
VHQHGDEGVVQDDRVRLVHPRAIGVLSASAVAEAGSDRGTQEAWFYITLLTIGYMVSRGLATSGSRELFDDDDDDARGRQTGR